MTMWLMNINRGEGGDFLFQKERGEIALVGERIEKSARRLIFWQWPSANIPHLDVRGGLEHARTQNLTLLAPTAERVANTPR